LEEESKKPGVVARVTGLTRPKKSEIVQ